MPSTEAKQAVARFGSPNVRHDPLRGRASFRVLVLCVSLPLRNDTSERTLRVLQAANIRPFAKRWTISIMFLRLPFLLWWVVEERMLSDAFGGRGRLARSETARFFLRYAQSNDSHHVPDNLTEPDLVRGVADK